MFGGFPPLEASGGTKTRFQIYYDQCQVLLERLSITHYSGVDYCACHLIDSNAHAWFNGALKEIRNQETDQTFHARQ